MPLGLRFLFLTALFFPISQGAFGAWTEPRRVSVAGARQARVAVSESTVHVVWSDDWGIQHARSLDCGETWSAPVLLESAVGGLIAGPSLAVSGADVHVAWTRRRGEQRHRIRYTRSPDMGESWRPPIQLGSRKRATGRPAVAAAGDRVFVAWATHRGEQGPGIFWQGGRAYITRSLDGGDTWSRAFKATPGRHRAWSPKLATAGDRLHLAWANRFDGVFHRYSDDDGATWRRPQRIARLGFFATALTADESTVHALTHWTNDEGLSRLSTTHSADVGETWSEEQLHTPTMFGGGALAQDGRRLELAWQEADETAIYQRRSQNGGQTWRTARGVAASAGSPAIAAGDSRAGRCARTTHLLLLSGTRGDGTQLYHQRRPRRLR